MKRERGRPKQYDVSDRKVCETCKYQMYGSMPCCGYALQTGKLRMFKGSKRRLRPYMCDKYEPKEEGHEWISTDW